MKFLFLDSSFHRSKQWLPCSFFYVGCLAGFFFLSLKIKANASEHLRFQASKDGLINTSPVYQKFPSISWLSTDQYHLDEIRRKKPESILLQIPGPEGEWTLELHKVNIESPGFRVRKSGGQILKEEFSKVLAYRGSVRGKKSSFAAVSISPSELSAVFSFGTGNFNLSKYSQTGATLYALFNDRDTKEKNPFQCHTDGLQKVAERQLNNLSPLPSDSVQSGNCRRVDIYFECDHQLFLDQGGSVPAAVNFVESLFNAVAAIYAQEGINIRISEIFVHDQPDNYPSGTSFEALDAFRDSILARPFSGNLGHLLSTLPRANGGVAYLNALCTEGSGFNIGYSNIYNSFLPLPFYSWNVNVVAHELGHNFGSPHTQSCSWEIQPGVFGMLDSCFTAEGDCYLGPRIATVGTVMSYCHLMNLGVDLSKGFGPQPGDLIRTNYFNAACLSGAVDFPPLSVSAPDSICTGSTIMLSATPVDGASCSWSGPGGFSSSGFTVSIPAAGAGQSGEYTALISKDGCDALPLSTRFDVNCIFAIPQTNHFPCMSSRFMVDYQTTFQPLPGNQFIVEISDAEGSFSNPKPIGNIFSAATRGSIAAELPLQLPADTGYLIRIRSTLPSNLGEAGMQKLAILPLQPPLSVQDVQRCGPGLVNFQVLSSDSVFWYASENAAEPLAQGTFFQTPVLDSTTTYWVNAQRFQSGSVGPSTTLSGDTVYVANTYHGIFVKVKTRIIIDELTVFASGAGIVNLNIKDSMNTFTYKTIAAPVAGLPDGDKVFPGIELGPGVYRIDAQNSSVPGLLRLSNFFSYPMVSEGMDITGASVPGRYYFFFDLKYRISDCPGERKMVKAEILPEPAAPSGENTSRCGPGRVVLRASGASSEQSYRWYNSPSGNPISGEASDSLVLENQQTSAEYYVSVLGSGSCESNRKMLNAIIYPQPENPFIVQEGSLLIASIDTLFSWYRNGVLLGVFRDTLDAEGYGNGLYQAVLVTSQNCRSESNLLPVLVTGGVFKPETKFGRIFPNPVGDLMTLQFFSSGNYFLEITDAAGRRIQTLLMKESGQIDVQALAAGLYILHVRQENSRKFEHILWIKN